MRARRLARGAVALVRQGVISMDMALERAGHPDELKRLLGLVKAAA